MCMHAWPRYMRNGYGTLNAAEKENVNITFTLSICPKIIIITALTVPGLKE